MSSTNLTPALIAAFAVAIAIAWTVWSIRDLPFDAARWHPTPSKQSPSRRLRMAHWMVKRKYLFGKTEAELVNLLGPPSDAPWFKFSNWDLAFDLDDVTFYLDSLALVVKFDRDGRVAECGVFAA